jgi:hypothetical protein
MLMIFYDSDNAIIPASLIFEFIHFNTTKFLQYYELANDSNDRDVIP